MQDFVLSGEVFCWSITIYIIARLDTIIRYLVNNHFKIPQVRKFQESVKRSYNFIGPKGIITKKWKPVRFSWVGSVKTSKVSLEG